MMRNVPVVNQKKLSLIVLIHFFFLISTFAQKTDFTLKVDSLKVNEVVTYNITVNITMGTGPFTIFLYDGAPIGGGKEIQKQVSVSDRKIMFQNLEKKNYYVFIISETSKSGHGKKIDLTNNR